MEPELQSKPKLGKKGLIPIILAVFIFLMLSCTVVFSFKTLHNGNIYKGVRIGSVDASGMSRDDLKKALDSAYQASLDKLSITLKTETAELKAGYPELHVHYDTKAAAEEAYSVGRSGNIFRRLYDIASTGINGKTLEMPLTYDRNKLDQFIGRFYDMTLIKVRQGALLIADSSVTLRSGHHGENVDKDKISEQLGQMILERKGGTVKPEVIMTTPLKFSTDELYSQISSKPVNASYKMENGSLKLVPHVYGREIDKSELDNIIQQLYKTEDTERMLPVTLTKPAVTSDMASSLLFRDELAAFSSYFSTATQNGKNRSYNMGIAVSKINNLILAPGDEFSYNRVVGPRDVQHGFKPAHIYSAGKIIDGIGGGICQVSSTMYNAVLKADLKVTERRNHSFSVAYVPLGQDATAYYGGTDFRFVNSTNWPVQLFASVRGNAVYISMRGTNETPNKSVIISQKVLKTIPYTIRYTDDPSLPAGSVREKMAGETGYVVETYKTIKLDGEVLSQTKLHTSVYKMLPQEMLRGTKKTAAAAGVKSAEAVKETTKPATTSKPSTVTTKPSPEKPAATTKPASTEKPAAAEKPAAEKPAEPVEQTAPPAQGADSQTTTENPVELGD